MDYYIISSKVHSFEGKNTLGFLLLTFIQNVFKHFIFSLQQQTVGVVFWFGANWFWDAKELLTCNIMSYSMPKYSQPAPTLIDGDLVYLRGPVSVHDLHL